MTGSNSSGSSSQSLHSQVVVNPADLQSTATTTRKANAHWGSEHIKEMLNFLIDRLSEMGKGSFKAQVWNQVAAHMRSKFPLTEGEGERTAELCKSKFSQVCLVSQLLIITHTQ